MSLQPHQTVAHYLFTVLVVTVSLLHQQLLLLSTLLFLIIILLQPVETSFNLLPIEASALCQHTCFVVCILQGAFCRTFCRPFFCHPFLVQNAHEQNANFITLFLSRHIHAYVLKLFVLCFPLGYFVFLRHHYFCFVLLRSLNFLKVFVVNFNPLAISCLLRCA